MTDMDELASAYWARHRLGTGDRAERLRVESGERAWAYNTVAEAADEGGSEVLAVLDALLEHPDANPCVVGAGPLEDLLTHQGVAFEQAIADRCRISTTWRAALACVWLDQQTVERFGALRLLLPDPVDRP